CDDRAAPRHALWDGALRPGSCPRTGRHPDSRRLPIRRPCSHYRWSRPQNGSAAFRGARTNFLSAGPYFVNEEDDPALVLRCREGDRDAFERLVMRYQKPVFNVALRMLRNRQDALDVAQTTFLKAFEHLADYDPAFRFYSWLYRIAINESLNALALRRPRGELDANTA